MRRSSVGNVQKSQSKSLNCYDNSIKNQSIQMKRKADEDVALSKPTKRWSVTEVNMEADMMEDLGVQKLGDENTWYCTDSSCDSTATTSTVSPEKCFPKRDSTLRENVLTEHVNAKLAKISKNNKTSLSNNNRQSDSSVHRHELSALDDSFFLYRKNRPELGGEQESLFPKLPDEIILYIFSMLNKQTLVRCAQVCKKWLGLAYDESFWTRLDLSNKTINAGQLECVLPRGTNTLRLAQAEIEDPVLPNGITPCKLQFLDLSMAVINENELSRLLECCKLLKKLSLEHVHLNDNACKAIGKNINMETLNLAMCSGLTIKGLGYIIVGCRRLTSLNLAWTSLSELELDACTQIFPKSITRLNLSGCRKALNDKHVKRIAKCCSDLVELDLSDSTFITEAAVDVVSRLSKLEHLAVSRCYNIPTTAYSRLSEMSSLLYLDVFSLMNEEALTVFQRSLPHILLNKFNNSSVARPTVGVRRTSIWGLRVRD